VNGNDPRRVGRETMVHILAIRRDGHITAGWLSGPDGWGESTPLTCAGKSGVWVFTIGVRGFAPWKGAPTESVGL